MPDATEERVLWKETFYSETLDFRGRINFCRYDECVFVKCKLLMDADTEQIAFTKCTFKDCNIDSIDADETRGIVSHENTFERPLEHFPTGMNRWGFPKWRESGSSCVLAKEVSMHGQGAFR
jgi:hypothetical protein